MYLDLASIVSASLPASLLGMWNVGDITTQYVLFSSGRSIGSRRAAPLLELSPALYSADLPSTQLVVR